VIVKIVILFLIAMGILAMFGKLRLPKLGRRPGMPRLGGAKCPACGRHRIGKGPCPCGRG